MGNRNSRSQGHAIDNLRARITCSLGTALCDTILATQLIRSNISSINSISVRQLSAMSEAEVKDKIDDDGSEYIQMMFQEIKESMLNGLKDYQWLDEMRLKVRTYIQHNGTVTISVAEIRDAIIPDALASFPQLLKDQMMDLARAQLDLNKLLGSSQIKFTPTD